VKKEQNGRKSLRRLKPTVGCNASKRRRRRRRSHFYMFRAMYISNSSMTPTGSDIGKYYQML
jgi:hypothetical protein